MTFSRSIFPVVALSLALARAGAATVAVQYADGRLTAHLQDADLKEVLQEVARQAQLEVRGMPAAPKPLTIRLDAVPIEDALGRLLAGHSFVLTYNAAGLKGVRLMNGVNDDVWVIPPGKPGWTEPPPPEETGSLAASRRPFAIGGRLARALGRDETNFSEILGVAAQDPDTRVRADALRVALRILDNEPELQGDLIRAMQPYDDAALARWLTGTAGEYAHELARRAARAGSGVIRERAAGVAKLLEPPRDGGG